MIGSRNCLCVVINVVCCLFLSVEGSQKQDHIAYPHILLEIPKTLSGHVQKENTELFNAFEMSGIFSLSADKAIDVVREALDSAGDFTTFVEETGGKESNGSFDRCLNQTKGVLTAALMKRERWALQMLDAAGKPHSGLLEIHLRWPGDYEECINAVGSLDNSTDSDDLVKGRYCSVVLSAANKSAQANPLMQAGIGIGLCVPDVCNSLDLTIILKSVLQWLPLNMSITPAVVCEEDLTYDTKAIAALCVSGIFILLIIFGTLYDVIFIQMEKSHESLLDADTYKTGLDVNKINNSHEQTPLLNDIQKRNKSHGNEDSEQGVIGKILLSFSVYTNGMKILSTDQPSGSLRAVHGIRFLSMTWVILGHTYGFIITNAENFMTFMPKMLDRWTFQVIANATVSVDTFFVLSGLLVSYLTLKEMKKTAGKINWFMFYFHRFWRLTPPYMLLMLVYVPLFPYMSSGPFWPQQGVEVDQCKDTWWTNLLYVNNFVNIKKQCMAWSWYLANDMQFYILSPLIFVPFFYSTALGIGVAVIFLLATTITAGVISRVNHLDAVFFGQGAMAHQTSFMFDYYMKPYCRMGPYIIGLATGFLLYKTDCKVKMQKILNLCGWAIATASALAVVYGLFDYNRPDGEELSLDVAAFYNAVSRTVWGMCVAWVVFICATGRGGYVNTLLSWKGLIPLSRLTYGAYLVHPIVICLYSSSQRKLFYLTDLNVIYIFFGTLVASYSVAFVLSLAFESPMMGLEKAFLRRKKRN